MQKVLMAPLLGVLLIGCDAQDIPVRSNMGQSIGSGGQAGNSTTSGVSGSIAPAGVGGAVGMGGSNGLSGSTNPSGSSGSSGAFVADASSTATDSSVSTPDAEGAGYPEASTCAGYAGVFQGFSEATISTRPVQDDFTLEAWIKTTDARAGANNFFEGSGLIYADVGGSANDFGSSVLNGKFAFGVGNPDTTILSTTTVNTGQWIHVAATRKMSTGEIMVFVNGTMEASLIVAQTSSLNANTMMTLGANTVDTRYFTGEMDEVRVWSVVRTQPEIAANMHRRMMGNEAGLAGYYRFDEPGSDTATDLSAKKGDATLLAVDWAASDAPICN